MKRLITFALFCAVLISASTVVAQRKGRKAKKEDPATTEAAALYKMGAEEYLRGNYVDALAMFRKGYDLKPNGMFLYNISLVYGKLDNYSEALEYAERADEDDLPPEAWARNMPRILAYRMALRSQDLIASRGQCLSDLDCMDGWTCNPSKMCEVITEELPILVSKSEPTSKPTWLGWTGLTLTAGGAAVLSLALLKNFEVDELAASYERLRLANDDAANAKRQEVEDAQSQGQLFLYVGAGVAAVGLGLFIYDLARDTEPALSLMPVFGEDSVEVWATGSFD